VTLRLLAVHAHPDDESSKGAATYAYYRSLGARVLVVSCTGGELGDIQNPELGAVETAMADRDMGGLRRVEMAGAQAAMDIEHRWLGFTDSGLPEDGESIRPDSFAALPIEFPGAPLVKIFREFRPHVLVSYDENGGYPHPDHIRSHEVAVWAKKAAADATVLPELGAPWTTQKHYYDRIFNSQRVNAVYAELFARDPEGELTAQFAEMREWMSERGELPQPTTRVPAGEFFETRDRALRSHASQVPLDSKFFYWPNDVQAVAWPTEDFDLVESLVETELPETDLFAGISADAGAGDNTDEDTE